MATTIQLNAHLDTLFLFHLALDDLGSDFWTGSHYSKYKMHANLSVIYVQSDSATV